MPGNMDERIHVRKKFPHKEKKLDGIFKKEIYRILLNDLHCKKPRIFSN
jgi:hypothetical protein